MSSAASGWQRSFPNLDQDTGKKLLLFLFLLFELGLIAIALWPTCWLLNTYGPGARTPMAWVVLILAATLVFNYAYVLLLLVLRVAIPRPKEGFFPRRSDGRPPREAGLVMLNTLLAKARFHTPWAGLFSSVLVNIFPLHGLYRRLFGPNTSSITLGDTIRCLDPYLVQAGRNVQFGYNCLISGHIYDDRGLYIQKIEIGDYAIIGSEAIICPGTKIGHHAMVAAASFVLPDTVINPYEFWSGNPARKRKARQPQKEPESGSNDTGG
jgi:hypothetical protein